MQKTSMVLLSLVLVAACAADENVPDTPAPQAAARIVSPADGDTVGTDVPVVLSAEGFTLALATGTREEGIGHFHLFLDVDPTPETDVIPPNTETILHIGSGDSTHTYTGLAPGEHRIIVVAAYGDHVPMPTARDTVRFVVRP